MKQYERGSDSETWARPEQDWNEAVSRGDIGDEAVSAGIDVAKKKQASVRDDYRLH